MATTGTYYHVAAGLFYGEHWDFNGLPIAPHHFSIGGIYNLMENYMFFQLKVRLNICISLTGMSHQMVFTFCAHILNSHIAWHSRKITVA